MLQWTLHFFPAPFKLLAGNDRNHGISSAKREKCHKNRANSLAIPTWFNVSMLSRRTALGHQSNSH
jgi:hypothetical protein